MSVFWGRSKRYRYRTQGDFYCPGCRQTVACLRMETVRITRLLLVPVFRWVGDSGMVKCPVCGGVFDSDVTAFSPLVSKEGFKPALTTVLLLMADAGDGGREVEKSVVSRIVSEVTGQDLGPEAIGEETRHLLAQGDALGDQLAVIAPYLTNGEKRMVLESALRVAHSDGHASEKEMVLMRRIAGLLEVPDAMYRRVTGDTPVAQPNR